MENNLKKLLEKHLLSKIGRYPVSLFHGKMGLSIYFYHLSKKDPVYHKTKYVNQLAVEVKTDFLGIWDVDVIVGMNRSWMPYGICGKTCVILPILSMETVMILPIYYAIITLFTVIWNF